MHAQPAITPWYRQFWPWFIIALPASAVLAGLATLAIAIRYPDAMVVDDYYKEGLAINRQVEKQQAAASLGAQALIRFDAGKNQLMIEMIAPSELLGKLRLYLIHPTLAGQDQVLSLSPAADGRYHTDLPGLGTGRWHVALEPENGNWRLEGRMRLTENAQLLLTPDH